MTDHLVIHAFYNALITQAFVIQCLGEKRCKMLAIINDGRPLSSNFIIDIIVVEFYQYHTMLLTLHKHHKNIVHI